MLYRSIQKNDTIAATSTPPGEGAIAVVRLSGNKAFEIAASVFTGPVTSFPTHTAHYGKILSKDGETIDHVLLLVMKNPRSYTGEDTVEISCHGGNLISRRILERLYEAGARPAEPGEFSFRAFLNGKIDLAQAEAVQELIAAKSERAMEQASRQLEGAPFENRLSVSDRIDRCCRDPGSLGRFSRGRTGICLYGRNDRRS